MNRTRAHPWPLALLFIFFIVISDQLSKWWAFEYMLKVGYGADLKFITWFANIPYTPDMIPYNQVAVTPFLNLVTVWNTGISFGFFDGSGPGAAMILTITGVIITIGLTFLMFKTEDRSLIAGLCLIIGGAVGNLIDRFRFGAVIDWLDFYLAYWHYPAFNLADTCIVLGVCFIFFDSLFLNPQKKGRVRHDIPKPPKS